MWESAYFFFFQEEGGRVDLPVEVVDRQYFVKSAGIPNLRMIDLL